MRKSLPPKEKETEQHLTNIQLPRTRLNRYQSHEAAEEANRQIREQLRQREQDRGARYTLLRTQPLPPPSRDLIRNSLRRRMNNVDLANPRDPVLPIFPEAIPNSVPPSVMGDTQMQDFPVINFEHSTSLLGQEEPEPKKGGKRKYKTRRNMKSKKYKKKHKSKNTRKYKKSIKKLS